tara:strand:+ start:319 stop:1185 length:867 start_codon:yes stop_codon:yes gene_type:complete
MIISHYDDNANIFHVLLKEFPVMLQYTKDYGKRYDLLLKYTKGGASVLDYRKLLYTPFFNVVMYNIEIPESINLKKFRYFLFNPFKFQNVKRNNDFCNALCTIKDYYYVQNKEAPKLVFSLREKHRKLYDTKTNQPIEGLITEKYGNKSIVYFESLSPIEQLNILQNCRVFCGVHGANLVNLVFTRSVAHIIEIDFKSHWYCDPVCDAHFTKKLQPNEKCEGKLSRGCYHKGDYHNLALLCGKTYSSLSAEYCEEYIDRNPINVQKVYIDFSKLSIYIDNVLTSMDKL